MGVCGLVSCLKSHNRNYQELSTTVVTNATFEGMDNEGAYFALTNNDKFVFIGYVIRLKTFGTVYLGP